MEVRSWGVGVVSGTPGAGPSGGGGGRPVPRPVSFSGGVASFRPPPPSRQGGGSDTPPLLSASFSGGRVFLSSPPGAGRTTGASAPPPRPGNFQGGTRPPIRVLLTASGGGGFSSARRPPANRCSGRVGCCPPAFPETAGEAKPEKPRLWLLRPDAKQTISLLTRRKGR